MNNIQKVSDSYMCSNCGACKAICPKTAIDFKWSSMGRMFAQVNEKCVNCGICTKVCPTINNAACDLKDQYEGHIEALYTGRATDDIIFKNAQSGGAVTSVLYYLFKTNKIDCAVVCRMKPDDTPIVESAIITEESELLQSQKSCYTPVDMLSALKNTREFQSVAFVGLPCHIQGLTLLQKKSKQLDNVKYKLGLICDRTLCASIQDLLVAKYTHSFSERKIKIDWKRKYLSSNEFCYQHAPIVIYSNKDEFTIPNSVRFYLKEPFTPPRCRVCPDKINVMADLVFGDPWRMENVDLVKGESVIIARTTLGNTLIEEVQEHGGLLLTLRNNEEIISGQLISERKEQVSLWKEAVKILPTQLESHITHSSSKTIVNDKKLAIAQTKLRNFLEMEKLSKSVAVGYIIKDVARFEKRLNSPMHRIITGIMYRIKRIINN